MLKLSKKYLKLDKNDFDLENTKKLQNLISYHSDLYYNKEKPIISDYEYDLLFKKLEFLEEKFDLKNKETSKVWAEVKESTFEKVTHSRPMISLWNTYDEKDLRDFDERVEKQLENQTWKLAYCLEYKFDGLWIEIIYKNGKFVQAITRWNGIEWEDVTQNVFEIENIPKVIDYKNDLEVRWEVILPISEFEKINKKALENWEKVFSNPRNAASWSLRTKDILVTRDRKLKFFAYDLANFWEFIENIKTSPLTPLLIWEGNMKKIEQENQKITYFQVIKTLEKLGFEISSYFELFKNIEEIIEKIQNFWDYKKDIDFEVDWLVLKVNNIDLWEKIGWTQHHPRYATAYKFPAEIFTTKVLSVDNQVWRTWTITPVANLETINIWWVNVKRATLHNYEEVEKLWVKIGDYVFIKRAWEVIPKIISVASKWKDTKEIFIPEYCPSCWEKVQKDEDKVRYYCPNSLDCPAQHSEKLVFAVWKQALNIDWLGERQVKLFLELAIIHNLVDIFKLEEKKEDILALEWFQKKSVNNLIEAIKKAKILDVDRFINALQISGVGKKTAKNLRKIFTKDEDFLNFSYSLEDLEGLEDIWPELAKNIYDYFNNKNHKNTLKELLKIIKINYFQEIENIENTYFSGKKVCITWSFLRDWEKISRDDLIELLEKNWWNFVSSVSKNTDFLLAWEKAGSKLEKAKKFWVKVLSLEEFEKKLK